MQQRRKETRSNDNTSSSSSLSTFLQNFVVYEWIHIDCFELHSASQWSGMQSAEVKISWTTSETNQIRLETRRNFTSHGLCQSDRVLSLSSTTPASISQHARALTLLCRYAHSTTDHYFDGQPSNRMGRGQSGLGDRPTIGMQSLRDGLNGGW